MIYVKTYEGFFANTPGSIPLTQTDDQNQNSSYAVGDVVNINYQVPKGKGKGFENVIASVKITKVENLNGKKAYIASFDLRAHQDMFRNAKVDSNLFNAKPIKITDRDIINVVSKINTPAGPDWIANDPNIQIHQVSNDMYM